MGDHTCSSSSLVNKFLDKGAVQLIFKITVSFVKYYTHTPDWSIVGILEMMCGSTDLPPRALARRSRLASPAIALLHRRKEMHDSHTARLTN